MRNSEVGLGSTLRIWRNRVRPSDVGLPTRANRRVMGLRREELAELTSLSVDYIVRLEQGRAIAPSATVVASLARALRLSPLERDHLYSLAGLSPPGLRLISDEVSPGVHRILQYGFGAAAVFSADWQMLEWNELWQALIGDPNRVETRFRNYAFTCFPLPNVAVRLNAWPIHSLDQQATEHAVVADLRRASVAYPDDQRLSGLIDTLLGSNDRFKSLWMDGTVGHHVVDRKVIAHPLGPITVDCDVLYASGTDLKIVLMTVPEGSQDAKRIDELRAKNKLRVEP